MRVGKVKDVYDLGDRLLFNFSDRISVFDKIIPVTVKDKGESLCKTAHYWFEILKEMGYKTDFIQLKSGNSMEVEKFRISEGGGSKFWVNFLIPLEFIMRHYVAGSLFDRMKSGEINFRSLGLQSDFKIGDPLDVPFFEMTTKFEITDRPLSFTEASKIGGLYEEEIYKIRDMIERIDARIQKEVGTRGLIHADGKKELALSLHRDPVIVDTFGTADEDRFWEADEFEKGNIVELSKESVRQYYRGTGYHKQLYDARKNGLPEPEIPSLPIELVEKDFRTL
jgi:Phosphoribosylaminoimidazolesuccinocarboxamide (SAICAR) synthase